MAKIDLELQCEDCGKMFRHTKIVRNRADAESYKEWAQDNITICPQCYSEAMRRKRREELDQKTQEAHSDIDGIELVDLTGTEKQIKWADDIRARAVALCLKSKPNQKFWDLVNTKTDSKWWIDHRDELQYSALQIAKTLKNN